MQQKGAMLSKASHPFLVEVEHPRRCLRHCDPPRVSPPLLALQNTCLCRPFSMHARAALFICKLFCNHGTALSFMPASSGNRIPLVLNASLVMVSAFAPRTRRFSDVITSPKLYSTVSPSKHSAHRLHRAFRTIVLFTRLFLRLSPSASLFWFMEGDVRGPLCGRICFTFMFQVQRPCYPLGFPSVIPRHHCREGSQEIVSWLEHDTPTSAAPLSRNPCRRTASHVPSI
eukprot:jgi/Botrbrau1/2728/Bobra.0164s0008.1